MEHLSDRLKEPDDIHEVFPWDELVAKSQYTLQRAIQRSGVFQASELTGFSFDLLTKISINDLFDARNVGPIRAEELINDLKTFFENLESSKDIVSAASITSQIRTDLSLQILSKIKVEEVLETYLQRIGSFSLLTPQERHKLLQDLLPNKNPFARMMFGKRDQEIALGHLIDANLRLSFALAKRLCVDRDIRARTIAANLGLLSGINSFSDKPNHDFESHIMKYVRGFIQNLVGSFNLSYDDILELIVDSNKHERDSNENLGEVSLPIPFQSCTTFSELYEELDRELLKLPKVDERAIAMLKNRHQAFGGPGLTLDEIGKKWGLTRERVRQIVEPLMQVRIQIEEEVPLLLKAVKIFEECEDEDQFQSKVADEEMFSGEDFSWQRLYGITRIISPEILANRVWEKYLKFESELRANSKIRQHIKKDRSKFGLYDLSAVAKKYEFKEDKAFKIIAELYPRSIRCGSLALARTNNLDTMFENSIAKQLKVASPLEVKELLIGLQRSGKQRDVPLIGSIEDLSDLIMTLAGNPPNYERVRSSLIEEIDFRTLEKWLIDVFTEANLGILHSKDVVNFALRDKSINVNSVMIYLLTSPIIRSHGKSLYSLVGTVVNKDQLDSYIQIIRGSSEASEVTYEMVDASKGILSVKPNLNVIMSGIVFPPNGYKKLFEGFEFETSCSCGQLATIQEVKFAPSGFWTGFTAMIRHGFSEHQMTKGSTFRFEFDFDRSVVKLLDS